ncbi:MAG: TonB-dependent receptor [Bacteroidetes bacterium]|nr:TonB-dependent receptor [Bacteroidota bacterium]
MPGRVLKIAVLLFVVQGMICPARGQASGIDTPVTVHADSLSLRDILDRIENQSGLSFSYSSRLFDDEQTVTIHVESGSLKGILDFLFSGLNVRYEVVEQQIVLKRARRIKVEVGATLNTTEDNLIPVRFTLSGYVRDALTGEVLIGATVTIPGGLHGTITNEYGFYSLTLRQRVKGLICSFVGYRQITIPVNGINNQNLHFTIEKEVARLSEVTVYSDAETTIVRTSRSSEERLRPEAVRKMPALFGEKDVIKSLAAIPGIKFFGDGSTIFYVRGGGRDQNLITIDEAPVYNPTHLLGFFSTIVPDAIKDVKVYKGDFPANYGGRLSSLIDIRTKDGNMNHFGFDGSVGLLSSRLSLEGPIWKEHISFFVSGRRSYITRPILSFNDRVNDLHFSDLHMKLNYKINMNNRIFFSIYNGVDNYEQQNNNEQSSGINWQNSTYTLRWNHLFSERLFSNLTILGSRYDYFLNTHIEEKNFWNSHVDNVSLKYDFTWYMNPGSTLRFGVLSAAHFYNPGNYYRGGVEFDPGLDLSTKRTRELVAYASNQFIINENLSIRAGIRLTSWQNVGPATEYEIVKTDEGDFERDSLVVSEHYADKVYHSSFTADPRISLVWQPAMRHILKGSYSRTSQFQYLITNSISPFTSLEVWLPSGPNVRHQVAHQFTLGYTHRFGRPGLSFDIEGYYKIMNNIIDYRDHARMLMNPLVEYELRFGTGKGYGVEMMLSKDEGRLNGWISYTLSRAIYQVEEVNGGNPYPAYSDRPHDFSLFLSWALHPRITLTGNFIYMTGSPFTTPTGFYYYDNHQVPIYAQRNNERLPDYHRLDVALNWHLGRPGGKFQHELIFSAFNLYNRKNPVALHFNKTEDENGSYVVPYDFYENPQLESTHFYMYGIVPSISYHFSF